MYGDDDAECAVGPAAEGNAGTGESAADATLLGEEGSCKKDREVGGSLVCAGGDAELEAFELVDTPG